MINFKEYLKEKKDVWKSYDKKLDKYVSDEIKKRKLARFPVNATDDIKMRMNPINQHSNYPHQQEI